MNNEILNEQVMTKIKTGYLNLGCENGWDMEKGKLFKALNEYAIPDSFSSYEISRCYYQYNFKVLIEGITCSVSYTIDSGG